MSKRSVFKYVVQMSNWALTIPCSLLITKTARTASYLITGAYVSVKSTPATCENPFATRRALKRSTSPDGLYLTLKIHLHLTACGLQVRVSEPMSYLLSMMQNLLPLPLSIVEHVEIVLLPCMFWVHQSFLIVKQCMQPILYCSGCHHI